MGTATRKVTAASITAAIVFVVTWTIRIPIPATTGGYVNFGDVIIYLSAYLLGGPVAAVAAAIGSALADTAAGAAAYIPATFVIKGLMGYFCGLLSARKQFPMYAFSCVIGGAVMMLGYGLYEFFIFGLTYAMASVPFNLIQWVGGSVAAIILFPVAKRLERAVRFG